jgi:outer membrane protein
VEIDLMQKTLLVVALTAALSPSFAMAEKGDVVVRLRATNINPDEKSKLDQYIGGENKLEVGSNTIPELDISYYFTKNIAAELILAVGSRHDVTLNTGSSKIDLGKVNLLPPTLLAQWHFNPDQTFDPYVGAGVSYIRAMDNGLDLNGAPIRIDRNSWGPALQAGMDWNLQDRWLVNVDVKKIWFDTDVKMNGAKIDKLDIDPWVVSVGFGKKF